MLLHGLAFSTAFRCGRIAKIGPTWTRSTRSIVTSDGKEHICIWWIGKVRTEMNNDKRSPYEKMWTTDRDEYYLVESPRSRPGAFRAAIVHRHSGPLTIDDDAVFREVLAQMRDAGVEVVTQEEHFQRQRSGHDR